jgi:hypothetical protein
MKSKKKTSQGGGVVNGKQLPWLAGLPKKEAKRLNDGINAILKKHKLPPNSFDLAKLIDWIRWYVIRRKNPQLRSFALLEPRWARNLENYERIIRDPNFKKEVLSLEPEEYGFSVSPTGLKIHPKQEEKKLNAGIKAILERYKLPQNFFDWIKQYVVSGEEPPWKPLLNWELADQIIENPDEASRIPLTTYEKKFVNMYARWHFGIKEGGRTPEKHQSFFKKLNQILSKRKNVKRRFRSMKTALKAASLHKEKVSLEAVPADKKNVKSYKDYLAEGQRRQTRPSPKWQLSPQDKPEPSAFRKKRYKDLVAELYEFGTKEEDEKRAQNLRSQKRNLLKRWGKTASKKSKN